MAKPTPRPCDQCGGEFLAASKLLSICSPDCRSSWNIVHPPTRRPADCVECGLRFDANKNGKSCSGSCQEELGKRLKRESHERNKEANNARSIEHSRKVRSGYVPPNSRPKPRKTCECTICHASFSAGPVAQYCSDVCRNLSLQGPRAIYACIECGSAHISWNGADTCSRECSKSHNAKTKAAAPSGSPEYKRNYGIEYRKLNAERLKEQKRAYDIAHPERKRDSRRRSKKYRQSAPKGEPYSQEMLVQRDGTKCYLCSGEMIFELGKKGSPWVVSVDHVIPLSRGGIDCASNVKLCHARCNLRKHDRLIEELVLREVIPMPAPSPDELIAASADHHAS